MWRAWPALGVALLLPALVLGHATSTMGATLLGVAAGYLVGGVLAASAASPERTDVRESWAMSGDEGVAELRRRVDILCRAESARSRGRLSPSEYLQVWAHVHQELDDPRVRGRAI